MTKGMKPTVYVANLWRQIFPTGRDILSSFHEKRQCARGQNTWTGLVKAVATGMSPHKANRNTYTHTHAGQ